MSLAPSRKRGAAAVWDCIQVQLYWHVEKRARQVLTVRRIGIASHPIGKIVDRFARVQNSHHIRTRAVDTQIAAWWEAEVKPAPDGQPSSSCVEQVVIE